MVMQTIHSEADETWDLSSRMPVCYFLFRCYEHSGSEVNVFYSLCQSFLLLQLGEKDGNQTLRTISGQQLRSGEHRKKPRWFVLWLRIIVCVLHSMVAIGL